MRSWGTCFLSHLRTPGCSIWDGILLDAKRFDFAMKKSTKSIPNQSPQKWWTQLFWPRTVQLTLDDKMQKNMTFQTVKMKSSHTFWVGKKKKKKCNIFGSVIWSRRLIWGCFFSVIFFFTCVPGALFFWSQFLSAARQRNRKNASNRLLLKSQLH